MDLELEGRTAIVTGGGRGIGKAIARELALAAPEHRGQPWEANLEGRSRR